MDMDPLRPKAIWGFNGTERPGAVYLAAVLAAHAQKVCLLLEFMERKFKMQVTSQFQQMYAKNYFDFVEQGWRLPFYEENLTSLWGVARWELPALS